METIKKKIVCPSCHTVLVVGYFQGIESKSFSCPKCKSPHRYSEYIPYKEPQDENETEIGDVERFRSAIKETPVQTDETDLASVKQETMIGSLKLPDVAELVQLKVGRNTIGREAKTSTASILVKDMTKTMSRLHYNIDVLVFGNTVRHLLSVVPEAKNETKLNGIKLEKTDKLVLNDGDIIRSGKIEVEFVLK